MSACDWSARSEGLACDWSARPAHSTGSQRAALARHSSRSLVFGLCCLLLKVYLICRVSLKLCSYLCMDSFDQSSSIDRSNRRGAAKRVLYRCKFCRLKTYVRTDMRHHLMREIGYKPYRCGHCYAAAGGKGGGYSEPSRSAMGKHFRLRHAGMTIDVHDLSDPERDLEVVRLLDECAADEHEDEKNASLVSGGCIKRSSLRNVSTLKQFPQPLANHHGRKNVFFSVFDKLFYNFYF